uniref:Uncharacterized protein n=1 Tax=Arundo donax TaxID=35708 RepID=A0A0A9GMD1_ARUDO
MEYICHSTMSSLSRATDRLCSKNQRCPYVALPASQQAMLL